MSRTVAWQKVRHPETQDRETESQKREPVEELFPEEDGLDKEVTPNQHENPRPSAAFWFPKNLLRHPSRLSSRPSDVDYLQIHRTSQGASTGKQTLLRLHL